MATNDPTESPTAPLGQRTTQLVWSGSLLAAGLLLALACPLHAPLSSARDGSMGLTIDLNSATSRELSLLPGVGEKLAERIIVDRDRKGPFCTLADLARVPGIGAKTVERIAPIAFVSKANEPASQRNLAVNAR